MLARGGKLAALVVGAVAASLAGPARAAPSTGAAGAGARPSPAAPASQRLPAAASQPARLLAFDPGVGAALAAPSSQAAGGLDLALSAAPERGPRRHLVKPFVEMASYQSFLVLSGWLYGHSPLDWDPPTWEKWKYNVTHAPVWHDGDSWALNLGGHAVFGSDHYLMARNCGWSWYSAILFNTFGSFTWEYVTEGIFERPSATDLVVTPILGSLLGEVRYQLFRLVRRHWGRRWYGYVALAVLDPTTMFFELVGWR